MIPKTSVLRIARPTDNLTSISRMYMAGLGFEVLSEFSYHNGFDGVIIGHPVHAYHLEFTYHQGEQVGRAPTQDNLLIFYISDLELWKDACKKIREAGFILVASYNPYWDTLGCTFEDIDGYRVVLQNSEWNV